MIDWFLLVDFGFPLFNFFLIKIEPVLCFRWNQLPSFFVLFLVSFDGFILIHMSHFVNTNFVFSCYFSVLFSPWMPAISFHLAVAPSYLFIYHRSHIINAMQTITGNVCANSNKSAVTVHAYVSSNGICRGFAFKYGKFLLPPRFLTALSVPKVPTRVQ